VPRSHPTGRSGFRSQLLMLVVAGALMAPGVPLVSNRAQGPAVAAGDPEVAEAWLARRLEIERRKGIEQFATQYRISSDLAEQIRVAAQRSDIDAGIAFGLVQVESSFRRTAVSRAGAVGYTQLLPSTARWVAPGTTRGQLFQTETNLEIGFRYLRYLLDKYDGDIRLALTAYNRGPGTVDRLIRAGRNPENGYAERVLRRAT
jgi:soluble lytic murein transglycosylase-like protein